MHRVISLPPPRPLRRFGPDHPPRSGARTRETWPCPTRCPVPPPPPPHRPRPRRPCLRPPCVSCRVRSRGGDAGPAAAQHGRSGRRGACWDGGSGGRRGRHTLQNVGRRASSDQVGAAEGRPVPDDQHPGREAGLRAVSLGDAPVVQVRAAERGLRHVFSRAGGAPWWAAAGWGGRGSALGSVRTGRGGGRGARGGA